MTIPFNLEKALSGEPIETKEGSKRWVMEHPVKEGRYILVGDSMDISLDKLKTVANGMWPETPPTLPEAVWQLLDPKIKYVAKDYSHEWYGFEERPTIRDNIYGWEGDVDYDLSAIEYLMPDVHWEKSLIERPERKA